MKLTRMLSVFLALIIAALAINPSSSQAAGTAKLRVIHGSPDAPAVDVYVDGARAFKNLAFTQITKYASLPSGEHHVQVFPAGAAPTGKGVIDANVTLGTGRTYSIAATGELKSIAPAIYTDRNGAPNVGQARIRFIHLSPNAPAVDIAVAGGPTLFRNVKFGNASRLYASVPAGKYTLVVRLAGTKTVALRVNNVRLTRGSVYTAWAMGLAGGTPKLQAVLSADQIRTM